MVCSDCKLSLSRVCFLTKRARGAPALASGRGARMARHACRAFSTDQPVKHGTQKIGERQQDDGITCDRVKSDRHKIAPSIYVKRSVVWKTIHAAR